MQKQSMQGLGNPPYNSQVSGSVKKREHDKPGPQVKTMKVYNYFLFVAQGRIGPLHVSTRTQPSSEMQLGQQKRKLCMVRHKSD